MNRVCRLVWSALLGIWLRAAEKARARGKGGSVLVKAPRSASSERLLTSRRTGAFNLALLRLALLRLWETVHAARPPPAATAFALGGQVRAGRTQVLQSGSAQLAIEQSSQRAAIDWQSLNIGSAASVNFIQPHSQAVTLNRELAGGPSLTCDKLTVNGQVFLSNASGVIFGASASVDLGALVTF